MSGKWYFQTYKDTIVMQARFEGEGGMVGDAVERVLPGESFHGIPYADLKKARAGTIKITAAGQAVIVP